MSSNPSQEQLLSQEAEGILEGKDLEKVVGGLKLPSCISCCFGGGSKTVAGRVATPADLAKLQKAADADTAARAARGENALIRSASGNHTFTSKADYENHLRSQARNGS